MIPRLIPDVNVLLNGITGREGTLAKKLYRRFRQGECRFVISSDLIEEFERILGYPEVLEQGITQQQAFNAAKTLLLLSEFHPRVQRYDWPSLSDKKDWYLFNLLLFTDADALVTQDKKVIQVGKILKLPVLHLRELPAAGYV